MAAPARKLIHWAINVFEKLRSTDSIEMNNWRDAK